MVIVNAGVSGCSWVIYGFGYLWLWLSMVMVIHGYIIIYGYPSYPWLSFVIVGYRWLSMVIHGYPWLSMIIIIIII